MAPTSPSARRATLSMKLLVDTMAGRVLYAEAGKEVVDFLFSLLALPVATAVKLIGLEAMVGSVGNLYTSVDKLDATYFQPGAAKDALLCPTVLSLAVGTKGSSLFCLPAPPPSDPPRPNKFFWCGNRNNGTYFRDGLRISSCRNYVTDTCNWICPSCRCHMNTEMTFLTSAEPANSSTEAAAGCETDGFVQGVVTYTVMDDLKVAPMSTISGITLLNTFGITDIGMLQEKTVQLGYDEGLDILRVSLQSKTVLTDVFLGKKQKA